MAIGTSRSRPLIRKFRPTPRGSPRTPMAFSMTWSAASNDSGPFNSSAASRSARPVRATRLARRSLRPSREKPAIRDPCVPMCIRPVLLSVASQGVPTSALTARSYPIGQPLLGTCPGKVKSGSGGSGEEVHGAAGPPGAGETVDLPGHHEILEGKADTPEDRHLGRRGPTRVHAGEDLSQFGVDHLRAHPRPSHRSHPYGQVAVVADDHRFPHHLFI